MKESVAILPLAPAERDAEVGKLIDPWIGDEGPLAAGFRRGLGDKTLRPRGVAFDAQTTVVWDEAGVQVLKAAAADPQVVALCSPVILHHRFQGPARLFRIDYLQRGALLGSRFTTEAPGSEEGQDGDA
ncbi:MAG TPA: hypothetical protein VF173_32315 [Thermoanaerobaculia bacterium]|nr:hypothetical protein [Thermoanaerobaculia bacterium]